MEKTFIVETSARHVHVNQETLEILFGSGYQLTVKKPLSQPGQYASGEKVEVIGPKKSIVCSILGPCRKDNQVELSFTDARTIGITAPIKESGDIANTPGCILKGPAGEVTLKNGVIIAKRHIHMTPEDAVTFGVKDKEIVSVKVTGTGREIVLGDTIIRVNKTYALAMHVDTDESNAGAFGGEVLGTIVK